MRMHAMASSWVLLQVQLMAASCRSRFSAVLLRSLPESVNVLSASYQWGNVPSFRAAALRWEQQQRAFVEFQPKKQLYQLGNESEECSGVL